MSLAVALRHVVEANDEFEVQRVGRRVPMEVFGVDTWVATPEDIVLSKLRWRLDSRSDVVRDTP